ncbi:MAG: hypothetical protein ACP5O7_13135, partial [Phycisphaerae bacterium]
IFVGSGESEIARIITESNCGYIINNGDVAALATLIAQLPTRTDLAAVGLRGRTALDTHYSRQLGCEEWEALLIKVSHQT